MMPRSTVIFGIALLAAISSPADPLDTVFSRIDAASKTFKGVTADISNTQHTALVDSDDVSTGTFKLLRVKADVTRLLVDLKGPTGNQSLALNGNEGRVYTPGTHKLDIFDLSSRAGQTNQYLLLGFGATAADLKANYAVTYVSEETIGGQPTAHLKLIPKSADTLRTLKQADLWYASNGLILQQKLLFAAGDYRLVKYSNMKLGAMPEKDLELKPKGAIEEKHK